MPAKTKIEWADYISNPIKARRVAGPYALNGGHTVIKQGHACIKISEGCANCWASSFNVRLGTGLPYTVANMQAGVTEIYLDEKEMQRIRKFKPRLPKGESTFKNGRSRPVVFPCDMTDLFGAWVSEEWLDRIFQAMWMCQNVDWLVLTKRTDRMLDYLAKKNNAGKIALNNIYLGCSVENQKRANERRAAMDALAWMGWKTWVSYEPALEVVNWEGWQFLNGLICGGESGVNARPMPPEAARKARDYCDQHSIPFFFKQWGEWIPLDHLAWVSDGTTFKHKPVEVAGEMMVKVGKGLAGHVLDGMTHNGMAG